MAWGAIFQGILRVLINFGADKIMGKSQKKRFFVLHFVFKEVILVQVELNGLVGQVPPKRCFFG
jgi:hypothetical protein